MAGFSLEELTSHIEGRAAALRCVTTYQPMAGEGSTVFPATYEGGNYATVGFRIVDQTMDEYGRPMKTTGRKLADQVVLDSVQSQANRMEQELLDAFRAGQISLPVITVDFSGYGLEKELKISSLEAPHRIADAILRDSMQGEVPFRQSELGAPLDDADLRNATSLFQLCPTALVFGMWDSTGPKGGLGAKFQRTIVSEILGLNAQICVKTSSRIDPLQARAAVRIQPQPDGSWKVAKNAKAKGAVSPAEVNHGNIPPTQSDAGVLIERAVQTTVISLPALRRLKFPLEPGAASDPKVDAAAQTTLAALALCGATLAREAGCDLRSRCQLFPTESLQWQLLDKPGTDPQSVAIDAESAIQLYNDSVRAAKKAGLPWNEEEVKLTPSSQLVELVQKSQQLATASRGGTD